MIQLYSTPFRPHSQDPTLISRWVSAWHPIKFQFRKYDWTSATVIQSLPSGKPKFTMNITIGETMPAIGDKVVISSGINKTYYHGSYTVLDIVLNGAGDQADVTIDAPYKGTTDIYISIFRPEYLLMVNVMLQNPVTTIYEKIVTRWAPDVAGYIDVNPQEYITGNLSTKDDLKYLVNVGPDKNNSGRFYLDFYESYTGSPETLIPGDSPTLTYFNSSVKFLAAPHGQNLANKVPFPNSVITEKAQFLSDFSRPTIWRGYPFDLAFLYNADLKGYSVTLEENRLNINKTVIGSQDRNITGANGYENRFLPIFPSDNPGYSDQVAQLQVWLEVGGVDVEGYAEEGWVEDGYAVTVPPTPPDAITPYRITEVKTIDFEESSCLVSPIYLRWKGSQGGWNYYMFSENQFNDFVSKQLSEVSAEPDDLEFAYRRSKVVQRSYGAVISMGANVPRVKLLGIRSIQGSPEIQIYVPNNAVSWLTVQLLKISAGYDTKGSRSDVSIQIELPENYTIQQ